MNRLKVLRQERDLTQGELAALMGSGVQTIVLIERYDYKPTKVVQDKLVSALKVTLADIWPKEPDHE